MSNQNFMNIQANNPQQSPFLLSLRAFKINAQDTSAFLLRFQTNGVQRLGLYRYPIEPYINAWKKFTSSLQQRVEAYSINPKSEIIISTALLWALPEWAAACSQMQAFSKQFCEGVEGEGVELGELGAVWEELQLRGRCKVGECNVEELFQVPFFLLEQLMLKAMQLASCLDERLRRYKQQLAETTTDAYLNMLSQIQIETRSMQTCLSQLNCILQGQNDQINTGGDVSVIRFNYIMQQYDLLTPAQKTFIRKFSKKMKFICGLRVIEKRRLKLQEERRNAILQLIKGQQNYIQGLTQYITNVKQPIQKLDILTKQERLLLFSTIIQIRTLHEDLLDLFTQKFKQHGPLQSYAPILQKTIHYFKVYTNYILNAEAAQKFMKELMTREKAVAEICRQYTAKTKKLAQNELLQPTFRIARYEMLFQEIIKKTSKSHPDYKPFIEVQATFKRILTEVNDNVDRIIRKMRLNDLDRQFATPQLPIYSDSRDFLAEFPLFLIREPDPQPVTLVVLSDLLLVIEEPSRKLLKSVPVNQDFFARRQEDNKIYRNMVTIHSDGFLTFTAGSDDLLAGRASELYELLRGITKESGQLVKISVLGTEEIGSTSFSKYTEYVIEVQYLDVKKLLHLRFSTIVNLVAQMQAYYQDSLKITQDEALRKSWFNSHKSKTIEARKLIIRQIFQRLFNHPLIKQCPAYFLKALNLPENFYYLARTSYERRISMAQTVTLSRLKRSYLTHKEEREAFTILCGTQIKLGRDLFHDIDNDEQVRKLKDSARRIQIKVLTLDQQEPTILKITEYDTVQDVCNRLSKLKGLRSNRDFRLFHQIGKKEQRVLEHQQIITKLFDFPQQAEQQVGFYYQMRSTFKKWVFAQEYPTLLFKKYYYLPYDIELAEMRKDLVRLRLMTYQVFTEVKDMKYQLTFDEYLLFLAMRIFIDAEGDAETAANPQRQIVHAIVPDTIFKLKNLSEEEWLVKCKRHVTRLTEEIQKVADHNRQQQKEGKLKANSVSKQNLYFGLKHLCSQVVLNKIQSNPLFGSNLFYVQPHNCTYSRLQQKGLNMSFNMWLAVSVNSLKLLSPSSKESVLELRYEDIGKTEVFSEAIVLKTAGPIEEEFRLNTYQSFEISQLVKYNQALNDIMAHLRDDNQLNARVKQYRDQLMQYRQTFKQGGSEPISLIRD